MANFLRHIGKIGDRKVAVVFRQIPGDEHMALVVYTETLNQNVHDPLMTCIESAAGQSAENLADALNRVYTRDGKIILQMLHSEGMLKRIQTEQVIMTPTPNAKSHVRLNELNDLLNEMAKGEEAVKKLAEIDASRGLQDPKDVARRMREAKAQAATSSASASASASASPAQGVIGDNQLAESLRTQAQRMAAEARGLLAESERLLQQAEAMLPTAAPAPKRGRAKKAAATT